MMEAQVTHTGRMDFNRYIGIPWRAGGRAFDGADCWGLVWLFYHHERGIELDAYQDAYGEDCKACEVGDLIEAGRSGWTQTLEPKPGDVAILRRAGHDCHVGIVAPRRHLLHVESAEAPSVLARIDATMKRRITGFYRWNQGTGRTL